MTALFWILFALATICAVSVALGVAIVWAVVRRIRRSRTALRARTALSWGLQRRLLVQRLRLADSLESGRSALDLAMRGGGRRGELPRLFRRIESEAVTLDAQLRLLETERDTAVLAVELPALERGVTLLSGAIGRVRASVSAGLGIPSEQNLVQLRGEVEREVAALHAGNVEFRRLSEQSA